MSARRALKFKMRRGNAFHASHQVIENSELFKKLDPGSQFQWERISSAVQPHRSLRRSEAEPSTSSRYRFFPRPWKVTGSKKVYEGPFGPRGQTVLHPLAYVDLQLLGLTGGKAKSDSGLHTAYPIKDRPKYASLSASQWLSRSGISRPPFRVRRMQTCLRTIGHAPLQSNLERDY